MRGIITEFLIWLMFFPMVYAGNFINEEQIKQNLQQVLSNPNTPNQIEIINKLQSSLRYLSESKSSNKKIKEYKKIIDNFPVLTQKLYKEKIITSQDIKNLDFPLSKNKLSQKIVQISSQLIELTNQLQKEQNQIHIISDSLIFLPKKQAEARKILNEMLEKQKKTSVLFDSTPIEKAKSIEIQTKCLAKKLKVKELDLAQLSANNRQELARLKIEIIKNKYDKTKKILQILSNQIKDLCQEDVKQIIKRVETKKQIKIIPKLIKEQLVINQNLSIALDKQVRKMELITSQQKRFTLYVLQVKQALSILYEQSKWLGKSSILRETLQDQISRLPNIPKSQQLNQDITKLRIQRLYFENLMNKLSEIKNLQERKSILTSTQNLILDTQIITQRNLLNALLTGCDTQILELTKLKITYNQLEELLKKIQEESNRYLFWTSDIDIINFSVLSLTGKMFKNYLTLKTFQKLIFATKNILASQDVLFPILLSIILVSFSVKSKFRYQIFLIQSSYRVGKANQDSFILTLRNIFWSIIISSPIPILWATLGYKLKYSWSYPIAVSIGNEIIHTVYILWILILCIYFSHSKGLFIVHFGWSYQKVQYARKYYILFISTIIPLLVILKTINAYKNKELLNTIGRLCFITLCIFLMIIVNGFKHANFPLFLDKFESTNNKINKFFWNITTFAPVFSIITVCLGYLKISLTLLIKFETSIFIWFFSSVIYYTIRRWILIQRRLILFERKKQQFYSINFFQKKMKKNDLFEQTKLKKITPSKKINKKILDLDLISSQSLRLIRSILNLSTTLLTVFAWSKLHSAFSFLERVTLWDITSTIHGINNMQPITLGSIIIAILIFIITIQMVQNLPALLELTLLQHLDLTPGTGYAITTLTKYSLMFLGGVIGFITIGIEWAKLQWLIAALGVGLGFGLQEIFANFISGLMILVEKPIRIGDTVTIRNLTGSISKINTRATTITDWDRKEIIVPNKAFITEQFINWSLSDTITRIVLNIPAPADSNIEIITHILMHAARQCSLVLEIPNPEVFLVDLKQGIPLFELRIYASEMKHRMLLRHQVNIFILEGYRKHNIKLPFPPFQVREDQMWNKNIPFDHKNNPESEFL